ncbi:GtrA family protein [Oerskovia enterophila]|uniref:GtrA family protein n=1 Tax=Oerskovia enterophila TaxID=43678 RepID=UPI0038242421
MRRPGTRVLRFALVGMVNTAIDLLLFGLLRHLGLGVLLANTVSTSAGLAFSFGANRRFTFGDRQGKRGQQAILFLGGTGVGLWVLQPVVILTSEAIMRNANVTSSLVLLWLPKILAIGCGLVWNFLFYDKVVFRNGSQPSPGDTEVPER